VDADGLEQGTDRGGRPWGRAAVWRGGDGVTDQSAAGAERQRWEAASRLHAWLVAAPAYPANADDLRSIEVVGLRVPIRATIAVVAVTLLLVLDFHGSIDGLVSSVLATHPATAPDLKRLQSIGRLVLLGVVPLLLVMLAMRDRPSRYGVAIGDWRAGIAIGLAGCALMTPIVLAVARVPSFTAYYGPQAASPLGVALTSALEVLPAEFFFRGFLMFALLRVTGPIAVVIATVPFAFTHLGKPEVETLSTVAGGLAFGWLDWRTGSVLWSGLAHAWILSLVVIAAGAAGPVPA
jgi:membrane protease YdiL (CAAX protease family)